MSLCECGCGKDAGVYKTTHKSRGQIKDQPKAFLAGHAAHLRIRTSTHCQKGHEYTVENTGFRKGGNRFCLKCRETSRNAFYDKHRIEGEKLDDTIKRHRLQTKYKMSLEQFNALLQTQGNVCAACGNGFGKKGPCVDHDHSCCAGTSSCGKCIRALLCFACNVALGLMKENTENLQKLIAYIEGFPRGYGLV